MFSSTRLIVSVHSVQLKQTRSGDYELRVDNGEWKSCSVQMQPDERNQRFSLKCNLNGVVSTFSAVITANQIDIFNEVSIHFNKICFRIKFIFVVEFSFAEWKNGIRSGAAEIFNGTNKRIDFSSSRIQNNVANAWCIR